ncbi:outer membrane efflux protein [Bacteroides helcogenes P 36-108]|uniref:Outer membrane efflux protein n=2 Tax=Bacteroides helcogenes TaxID=290053 RepID=E6SSG1_BACT6|nr:outer membrane efflux protein [Bacteroides helcogenes P 36-108]
MIQEQVLMKKILILNVTLIACTGLTAQTSGIDGVLRQIETNNKELQANALFISSQKLENRTSNNLPDPTLSYAHLWDSQDRSKTVGELVVSQSFDFPTLYATRGKMNRLKAGALDAQAAALRQQILLRAKEICLDIIMLQRRQTLLDERLKNAEELSAMYAKRMDTGDASVLETNKINLELLNVRTEARTNKTTLNNKLKELTALNGNQPLTPGRPSPYTDLPSVSTLGLAEYPANPLPADFRQVCDELLALDPILKALNDEGDAACKQVSASLQGWLPKLELGYRRNTESGHPLNGVVVGFSFPLFENRHKVKIAKSQALNFGYRKENAALQASSTLWQLYEEARNLHASIKEYEQTFGQQQDLALLRQALAGGQISMIEYFLEVSVVYQSKSNLLQLENQYQRVMAQIYKSRL